MKWYTCILFVEWHINRVQYFHTRAESVVKAIQHAKEWMQEPDRPEVDVEFVFEGRLFPIAEED